MAGLKRAGPEELQHLIANDAQAHEAWAKLEQACRKKPGAVDALRGLLQHIFLALQEKAAPGARTRSFRRWLKSLPDRMEATADDVRRALSQLGLEHLGRPLREWRALANLLRVMAPFSSPPRPVHAAVAMLLRTVRVVCGKPFYPQVVDLLTPIFRATEANALADQMLDPDALRHLARRYDQALVRLACLTPPHDPRTMAAIRQAERNGLQKLRSERSAFLKMLDAKGKESR